MNSPLDEAMHAGLTGSTLLRISSCPFDDPAANIRGRSVACSTRSVCDRNTDDIIIVGRSLNFTIIIEEFACLIRLHPCISHVSIHYESTLVHNSLQVYTRA